MVGYWDGDDNKDNRGGGRYLLISNETQNTIKFEVLASNGMHTCDVSGFAELDDSIFVYNDGTCSINFEYDKVEQMINVSYIRDCHIKFCGMSASISGNYVLKEGFLRKIGVFNELQDVEFRQRVGGVIYDYFSRTMGRINGPNWNADEEVFITKGWPAGLFQQMNAIIIKDGSGKYAAAIINKDIDGILYFTNKDSWRVDIPQPIIAWREELPKLPTTLVD